MKREDFFTTVKIGAGGKIHLADVETGKAECNGNHFSGYPKLDKDFSKIDCKKCYVQAVKINLLKGR